MSVYKITLCTGMHVNVGRVQLNDSLISNIFYYQNICIESQFMFFLAKLKEGVTFQHVIDTIRDPTTDSENYQRLLLIERKDLHNVTRDFNIDYTTKRHKNDAISVKLWVDEMKASSESPILYFKGQDEDVELNE